MDTEEIQTDNLSEDSGSFSRSPSQTASSVRMKQWWADKKAGKLEPKGKNTMLIILLIVGAAGILLYVFRDKLKTLWTKKFKEVITS